mmetsp:Transcript_22734/g.53702  ORF Transcript_22734/g.53702 Transcript_22734/m.53702 type:complete len:326 (-) Transcript_22734:481-1458(-)
MMAMKLQSATIGRKRMAMTMQLRSPTLRAGISKPQTQCRLKTAAFSSMASPPTSFLGRAWAKYTEALIARPLLVKGGAASFIFLVSDSATQKLMNPEADWDGSRALSGAGFGVVATCWLHYWWGFLEVVVNKRIPAGAYGQNKFINALGKVVADQLVGAPLYIYSYYCVTHFGKEWMAIQGTMKNEQHENKHEKEETGMVETAHTKTPSVNSLMKETSDRALEMLPDTILRHWTLWPLVHTINFYYNPIHHRVLVQNIVLIFWSGYLSHLNNGGLITPETEVEMVANRKQRTKAPKEREHTVLLSSHPNTATPMVTSSAVRTREC